MGGNLAGLGLLGLLAALPSPQARQRLDEGQQAAARLDFIAALKSAEAGLAAGDATADDTWRLYVLLAESTAAMDLGPAAQLAYEKALLLRPGFSLSALASPRLAAPFRAAQKAVKGESLRAVPSAEPLGGGRYRVKVRLEQDLHRMVAGGWVGWAAAGATGRAPLVGADPLRAELECPAGCRGYFVSLTDAQGNELMRVGEPSALLLVEAAPPARVSSPAPAAPSAEPWFQRPWPYFAGAAALAVASGVFGAQLASSQERLVHVNQARGAEGYRLSDAIRLDEARRQEQVLMFASGGAAVAVAAVGFWVW